jgi:uncharacterized membrane protein YebE (DUF533 family)
MECREELERWIASSRRVQQKVKLGTAAGALAALVLLVISRPIGGAAIAIVGLVALSGYWITAGHIADWEEKLYKLDHPEKPSASRRRYQPD